MASYSSFDGPGDGDFKKGRFKPAAIGVGVLLVVVGGAFAIFAAKGESARMSDPEIRAEERTIMLLPKPEQLPKWRAWAARDDVPVLEQDAFVNLAWARDPAAIPLIIKGLASPDHRVRGTAATALLEYNPIPDAAKLPLENALKEGTDGDRPQIAWALASLHDSASFDAVMEQYRVGNLSGVQRLDGNPAFDPTVLAQMVPLEKLAALAGDKSPSVRQLVATALSETGDARWLDTLTTLVKDPDIEVAREAAVGLGKIGNDSAMTPLLDALGRANPDSRQKFLEALRDGIGTRGLVLALQTVSHASHEIEKTQTRVLFEMMKDMEDPRGSDALVGYLATNPAPQWRWQAAMRLAEVGDLRAVPHLAWRLTQNPQKLYNQVDDPELRRSDEERTASARMLADLAQEHPEAHADMLAKAEDATLAWAHEYPQPSANALRFLAAAGSKKVIPDLKKWADPQGPLPKVGDTGNFPLDWAEAHSALRYLGWEKEGWDLLVRQLSRRPPSVDISNDSLAQGGLANLGMVLRGLSRGSADGFSQWGDSKAYPLLVKQIEDPKTNEDARAAECAAVAWVATVDQMTEVARKVQTVKKDQPNGDQIRGCYLQTLIQHPMPEATGSLVDLMRADADLGLRRVAAQVLGRGGLASSTLAAITPKLNDPNIRGDVVLAMMLGGTPDDVTSALAHYEGERPEATQDLQLAYANSFSFWSDADYANGNLARWVANAEAARHTRINGSVQDWPRLVLGRALDTMTYDNGPHSITRVRLRYALYKDAQGADAKKRDAAIMILKFLKEMGVLMALKSGTGPGAEAARAAFFEVMNPKRGGDPIPAAPSATGTASASYELP
jgi:HEAT repeat protein